MFCLVIKDFCAAVGYISEDLSLHSHNSHLFFDFITRCSSKGKKDVVHLFSNIVRRQIGSRTPTVEYISSHSQILFMLLKGYVSRPQATVMTLFFFQKVLITLAFPIDVMVDCGCTTPFPVQVVKMTVVFSFYSRNVSIY